MSVIASLFLDPSTGSDHSVAKFTAVAPASGTPIVKREFYDGAGIELAIRNIQGMFGELVSLKAYADASTARRQAAENAAAIAENREPTTVTPTPCTVIQIDLLSVG